MTTALLAPPGTASVVPGGVAPRPRGEPRGGRKVTWDLLRCACVLMVVLYHSTWLGPHAYRQFLPREFVFGHQIGASLLLTISAYFVAGTLARVTGSTITWWRAKLARLLPPFVAATVAAWAALRFYAPPGMFHPNLTTLAENLAMLWDWNGVHTWDYVDGSYWTVPLQLMAFTVAALIRPTPLGRGRPLRFLLWAAVLIPLAQWHLRETSGGLYLSVVDGFGLYRWHLFAAGVAVWMLSTGRLGRRHGAALLATCVAAHAVQIGEPATGGGFTTDGWSVLGVGLGVLAMLFAACGPDIAARLPAPVVRAITGLAGISYGVFLVHQTQGYVVMLWLQDAFGAGPDVQTVAMVVVGLGLGWVLTHGVERPVHRRLTERVGVGRPDGSRTPRARHDDGDGRTPVGVRAREPRPGGPRVPPRRHSSGRCTSWRPRSCSAPSSGPAPRTPPPCRSPCPCSRWRRCCSSFRRHLQELPPSDAVNLGQERE